NITDATTDEDIMTSSGLVISRNAVDTEEVTHFKISSITNGKLYRNDGVTEIFDDDFITFAVGNAGLKFDPDEDYFGEGSITIQAAIGDTGSDDLGGEQVPATITIDSVNDAPSFTFDNIIIEEDNGIYSANWATNISPGSSNENDQVLTFTITNNDNEDLFSVGPSISDGLYNASGVLTFTTAANQYGEALITVRLTDDGGTANDGEDTYADQTFTIIINPIADTPNITDATTDEDIMTSSGLV
ncbi:uncharacterized protein METZ01_LOCUS475529, partial [marine metagenome]